MTRPVKTQSAKPLPVRTVQTPKYRLPESFHYPDSFTKDEFGIYNNLSSIVYLIESSIKRDTINKEEKRLMNDQMNSLYELKGNNRRYFDQYMIEVWKYFEYNYGIELLRRSHEKGVLSKRAMDFIYFAHEILGL
jgi:hypothetical protein